ncbi:uncharacterized protein LOC125479712 [Pyrus x bretschneideri]|uniref:uncharacterized protein LOC125479712 n=1 Tax=Pyrus x bretschneideri TaxID=225117 RepID=UPI00202EEFBE|nr:uncharacterized protein LOC125479712 [Pyrus x bretschneideri]
MGVYNNLETWALFGPRHELGGSIWVIGCYQSGSASNSNNPRIRPTLTATDPHPPPPLLPIPFSSIFSESLLTCSSSSGFQFSGSRSQIDLTIFGNSLVLCMEKMSEVDPTLEVFYEEKKRVRNPWVPVGAMLTAGVLTAGLISFRQGNSQLGQKLMRARVVVQGATVALMVGSAYYYGENPWKKSS